jgi:AcrR family transcriptional regulator
MVERNSEQKKTNLLAAARIEFGTHGLAGARVDIIAKRAGCNKQLVYAYFTNKEGLFTAVYDSIVNEVIEAVPFNAEDLPDYAAGLSAMYAKDKDIVRIITWHRLERLTPEPPAVSKIRRAKIAAIKKAQQAGIVTNALPAATLLTLVSQLAMTGALAPEFPGDTATAEAVKHADIVEATRILVKNR